MTITFELEPEFLNEPLRRLFDNDDATVKNFEVSALKPGER